MHVNEALDDYAPIWLVVVLHRLLSAKTWINSAEPVNSEANRTQNLT